MKTKSTKRELIAPRGDKRYIRRDAKGRIKESDDVAAHCRRTGAGKPRRSPNPARVIVATAR